MDMGGMPMTMSMSDMTMDMPTATTTATAVTSTAMSMGNMTDMGMGGCKISMLWNWNTVDACFISESWRIKSAGMFAGSCIAVILLVIFLEILRSIAKEYDSHLIRAHPQNDNFIAVTRNVPEVHKVSDDQEAESAADLKDGDARNPPAPPPTPTPTPIPIPIPTPMPEIVCASIGGIGYRPNFHEQVIRALLHTAQFIVAYFLMLLAMYYNGYIIICIFIGAFIGSLIFQWDILGGRQQITAAREATVCCG
ncbi:Ctr-domain-containing protein [Hypoxylon sp. FL1857]|nr:Ctr-domain-containing protein [Hypoxylon sp. FL1857]